MYTLITFATQWGSKYGGINSFNEDFLSAFGFAYSRDAQVICIVASNTPEEKEEARKSNVRLVPLPYPPQGKLFSAAQAQVGIDELKRLSISFDPEKTIWLGHDRITGAAAIEAAKIAGGRSALIHHMSYDRYESYAEKSKTAYEKTQEQTVQFQQADLVLAVGPLLRDALNDLVGSSKPVHMLIPGLAEIESRVTPKTFTAFLSGRLSEDAARIKQGHLGVAAFAQAHLEARENGMPDALCRQPKLVLRGVDFEAQLAHFPSQPQQNVETDLKQFAEEYAHCVINLHVLPFTQNRQTLYSDLSAASVALMPSWHEGFGLVAWEAIAAGVPLIISMNSGVYRFLEDNYHGAGIGCVYPVKIGGAFSDPFFREEDLKAVVTALKTIANNPDKARKQAGILREMLGDYTWSACAEQVAKAFEWPLEKGSIPKVTPQPGGQVQSHPAPIHVPPVPTTSSPLQIPKKQWQAGIGMADSQLLRAEEAIVPFDPANQAMLDSLNAWLDDTQWPQAVRLITGAGGLGKTRLALELCRQRLASEWHAGFLDNNLEANKMTASWQTLRSLNQPLLIVIDYAETRQLVLLALIKAILQIPGNQPVRLLLLARDGGEWWDNLPSKDRHCEPLLSGYATSGPFHLPALYTAEQDRHQAYIKALHAFAQTLGVTALEIVPDLTGEHFERPLYLQMAALLALHGERPSTAEGLTKALLNHERRYWRGLLAHFHWAEPERHAQQLLALTTLAGGFTTPKAAQPYWAKASGTIPIADFNSLFYSLATLYPGKQGLQPVRPDLLGEALVAQSLLRPEAEGLLDAVLANSAGQLIRRNALTILARLSNHRLDLQETLVEALARHFAACCQDIVVVSIETTSRLPVLAELAFARLSPETKSQAVGLLKGIIRQKSVQLDELSCAVSAYLTAKYRKRFLKKPNRVDEMETLAGTLGNHSVALMRVGRLDEALSCALEAMELFSKLNLKDEKRFESIYAMALDNYANRLGDIGQHEEARDYNRQALEIRKRLAQKNPDQYEVEYARTLNNYANRLDDIGQPEEALDYARQALEIREQLAQKNPDRYEVEYAGTLSNYGIILGSVGQYEEALDYVRQALEIYQRIAQKNPDRYEPEYAKILNNYVYRLDDIGQPEEALDYARQALEIREQLAQKNPDRYEVEYAGTLSNYGIILGSVGQYEEALDYVRQALEIYQRMAQKNPARFDKELYGTTYLKYFLDWLCNHTEKDRDLSVMATNIPSHRRALAILFSSFVQAIRAIDHAERIEAFKQVLSAWYDLSQANKTEAQSYWLCAAAWCAKFVPVALETIDWQAIWYQYVNKRHGRLPHWMQDLARRLDFLWPAETQTLG